MNYEREKKHDGNNECDDDDTNDEEMLMWIGSLLQEWEDEFMRWDPAVFANITTLRVPCFKLWLPDIVLYNK